MESSYAVRYLLPAGSVETFYLLFPDPWPKRRHWQRRIVTGEFLGAISQALAEDGRFLIATDHLNYFGKIEEIARANPDFAVARSRCRSAAEQIWDDFREKSVPIHWLELRKVSPVR